MTGPDKGPKYICLYIGALVIAILWGGIEYNLSVERRNALELADRETSNLARVFENDARHLIVEVDSILRSGQHRFLASQSRLDLPSLAKTPDVDPMYTVDITLVDEKGRRAASTEPSAQIGEDLSARPSYSYLSRSAIDELFVGEPAPSRADGKIRNVFARALRRPDGAFGGHLTVMIGEDQLSRFYRSVDLGPGGGVMLLGTDGHARAGIISAEARQAGALFAIAAEAAHRVSGVLLYAGHRIAYRRVQGYPLIVAASTAEDAVLAGYTAHAFNNRLAAGLATFLLLIIITVATIRIRRFSAVLDQLHRRDTVLNAMFDNVGKGVLLLGADGKSLMLNRQLCEQLDLPPEFAQNPPSYAEYIRILAGKGEYDGEPEWKEKYLAIAETGINDFKPRLGTFHRLRPNGRTVEVTTAPIPEGGYVAVYTDVTERVRQDDALRHSKAVAQAKSEELASTLENMDQGLIMVDGEGIVRICNRRALELLLLPPDLFHPGLLFSEIVDTQFALGMLPHNGIDPRLQRFIDAGGNPKEVMFTERDLPNGRILEMRTSPLAAGGFVRTYTDITDRKVAEAERIANEAIIRAKSKELHVALDNIAQGLMLVNAEGRCAFLNRRAIELLSLPEEFARTLPSLKEIHAYQKAQGELAFAPYTLSPELARYVIEGGDPTEFPIYERMRPNGTVLEIRTVALEGGGWVRTYTDITERKQYEEAMRHSERVAHAKSSELAITLENMGQGIIMVDADGAVAAINRRALKLLELPDSFLHGRPKFSELNAFHESIDVIKDGTKSIDEQIAEHLAKGADPMEPTAFERTRQDGRTLDVRNVPLAGGGFVRTYTDITERKRAEAALIKSEEMYRLQSEDLREALTKLSRGEVQLDAMVSNIAQGILYLEPDGAGARMNRRLVELLDLPVSFCEERVGHLVMFKYLYDRGEYDPVPEYKEVVRRHIEAGERLWQVEGVFTRARPNGQVLEIAARRVPGGGFVFTYSDITERQQQEIALRDSEAMFRKTSAELRVTLENIAQGLIMVDADGRCAVLNKRAIELLGLPADYIDNPPTSEEVQAYQIAHGEFDEVTSAQNPELANFLRRMGDEDSVPVYERMRPNGVVLEVRTSMLPGGGFVRTYLDITERKLQEEAMRRSEKYNREKSRELTVTLENMSQGIILANAEGSVTVLNKRMLDLLGLPADFLAYRPKVEELAEAADRLGVYQPGSESIADQIQRHVGGGADPMAPTVFQRVRSTGATLDVRTVPLAGGGFVRTVTDITDLKQKEEALKSAARDLERFAHLATHDIQEPLRKITTYSGFLRDAIADGDQGQIDRCLDVLKRSAKRGRDIVSDLLRYSKLRNQPIERKPAHLDEMVQDIAMELQDSALEGQFVLSNQLPPLTVSCDPGIVRQVFENLIGNAIKYRKPSQIAHVSLTGFTNTVRDKFIVSITDDGIGFELAHKARIFEPFQRLVLQSEYQGTGIGLSLVRSVIEKHGWTIDVDSEIGVGSTFTIAIPLCDVVDQAPQLDHPADVVPHSTIEAAA